MVNQDLKTLHTNLNAKIAELVNACFWLLGVGKITPNLVSVVLWVPVYQFGNPKESGYYLVTSTMQKNVIVVWFSEHTKEFSCFQVLAWSFMPTGYKAEPEKIEKKTENPPSVLLPGEIDNRPVETEDDRQRDLPEQFRSYPM